MGLLQAQLPRLREAAAPTEAPAEPPAEPAVEPAEAPTEAPAAPAEAAPTETGALCTRGSDDSTPCAHPP